MQLALPFMETICIDLPKHLKNTQDTKSEKKAAIKD
jgi:hypothetical protein